MQRLLLSLSLLVFLAGCKLNEESKVKAIIGAVLIDGNGGPPITDSVVVISGSRIRAAGLRRKTCRSRPARTKSNGSGKFLTPGLIDVHVHLGTRAGPGFSTPPSTPRERIEKNLNSYLYYYGVTTVRSIGTERDAGLRRPQGRARWRACSPRGLFTAGRGFTSVGGHPLAGGRRQNRPARPTIRTTPANRSTRLAAQQVDCIKIWVDAVGGRQPKIKTARDRRHFGRKRENSTSR